MTTTTEVLERQLIDDLRSLGDRLDHDEKLATDLYGTLAGWAVARRGIEGHLALSWKRAEDIVNELRTAAGARPLEGLMQSGLEGRVSDRAREALESLGWEIRPRRTDEFDPAHVGEPEHPPRQQHEPPEWEREGHEEAELERHRRRTGETRDDLFRRHR
jgi:hypothetical protein